MEIATPTAELARVSIASIAAMPAASATTMVASLTVVSPKTAESSRVNPEGSRPRTSRAPVSATAAAQVAPSPTTSVTIARHASRPRRVTRPDARGRDRQDVGAHRHRAHDQDRVDLDHAVGGDHAGHDHEGQIARQQAAHSASPARACRPRSGPAPASARGGRPISSTRASATSPGITPRSCMKSSTSSADSGLTSAGQHRVSVANRAGDRHVERHAAALEQLADVRHRLRRSVGAQVEHSEDRGRVERRSRPARESQRRRGEQELPALLRLALAARGPRAGGSRAGGSPSR